MTDFGWYEAFLFALLSSYEVSSNKNPSHKYDLDGDMNAILKSETHNSDSSDMKSLI